MSHVFEPDPDGKEPSLRQRRMAVLSRAHLSELKAAHAALAGSVQAFAVRGPETGLVMIRGRAGGGGEPFNLGEATVTRATVRLGTGEIGHGQVLGTSKEHARLAAIFDGLWFVTAHRKMVDQLVATIDSRLRSEAAQERDEAAATRVDFFTMVRGDD